MILRVTLLLVFISEGIWGISEVINEGVINLLLRCQYLCLLTLLFGIKLALTERPVLLRQTDLLLIGSIIRSLNYYGLMIKVIIRRLEDSRTMFIVLLHLTQCL